MQTKHLDVTIQKSASKEYDATFVMSATTPDRVNDTISKSAYLPNMGKRLVALWQHQQDQPIGAWENLRLEGQKLIGDLKVANTNLGKMVKQLVADDVPLGASIGFTGTGERNEKGGIHFKTIELMECSVCSIPAHRDAIRIAKSFNLEEFVGFDQSSIETDDGAASGLIYEEVNEKAKAAILAAQKSIHNIKR